MGHQKRFFLKLSYGLMLFASIHLLNANASSAKTGPQTGRSLREVLTEIEGHYPSCQDLLADVKDRVVVDLGAGRSTLIPELRRHQLKSKMFRLDIVAPDVVPFAEDNDYLIASAASLPFTSESVDRIFAIVSVFLWGRKDLALMKATLSEAARVLKPTGRLVIAGADHDSLKQIILQNHIPLSIIDEEPEFLTYIVFEKTR